METALSMLQASMRSAALDLILAHYIFPTPNALNNRKCIPEEESRNTIFKQS